MKTKPVIAKIFTNGHSQAVRIPKTLEFKGISEVEIIKKGETIMLSPVRKSWLSFANLPKAEDDFMNQRQQTFINDRVDFDKQ